MKRVVTMCAALVAALCACGDSATDQGRQADAGTAPRTADSGTIGPAVDAGDDAGGDAGDDGGDGDESAVGHGIPCPEQGSCQSVYGHDDPLADYVCVSLPPAPAHCVGRPQACPSGEPVECQANEACLTGFQKFCAECSDRICVPPDACSKPEFADGTCSAPRAPSDVGL